MRLCPSIKVVLLQWTLFPTIAQEELELLGLNVNPAGIT